jgi:hypothetical protein
MFWIVDRCNIVHVERKDLDCLSISPLIEAFKTISTVGVFFVDVVPSVGEYLNL